MDQQLYEKPVVAMYDVRGIQSFIFKTNKMREIMGASAIVEGIIENAFKDAVKKIGWTDPSVAADWQNSDTLVFADNPQINAEVLYIGGGNAFVLYRNGSDCETINRYMSKYVLDKTYSLQLAIAVVEKTEYYDKDMALLHDKMDRVKATMQPAMTLGALPVVRTEDMTGYPVVTKDKGDWISEETRLKRKAADDLAKNRGFDINQDLMVTEKGSDSTIAVVHLDGNNMGMTIQRLMGGIFDYQEAVTQQRRISKNISTSFKSVYDDMIAYYERRLASEGKVSKQIKNYYRKIILAGDDLTFLCNGKYALSLVKYFAEAIEKKELWEGHPFSIGAGIAYIHNHYPFSIGYQVAEECCSTAKARGKETGNSINSRVGSWVDFQICKNVQAKSLEQNRKRNYTCADGSTLLKRPYCFNNVQNDFSYSGFTDIYKYFSDTEKIPRSMAKAIRNQYPLGEKSLEPLITFITSRKGKFPQLFEKSFLDIAGEKTANWYDVLEMLELVGEDLWL